MKFDLQLLPKFNLEQVTTENYRYYETEAGLKLYSVTTLLGRIPDKKAGIAAWRQRIGSREADMILAKASRRGTIVHDALENYILGNPYKDDLMPDNLATVNRFIEKLNENVSTVYGIEQRLYSEELQTAGTADLICSWNGINTIVDFKTSKKIKKEKYITDYFLQSTAYAMMVKELYDIDIEKICILIYVDSEHRVYQFQKNVEDLKENTRQIFKKLVDML